MTNTPDTADTLPRFPFVFVDVSEAEAEEATSQLFDYGAAGVEERDASTLVKGRVSDKVTLVASFDSHEDAHNALLDCPKEWNPSLEEVVGDAFRDAWKEHFKPFAIAKGLVVCPPWETYEAKEGEEVLVLEPGRAFGTGLHETTSLVSEALEKHRPIFAGKNVLDVGSGSGILAFLALKLGAQNARLIDNDPIATEVALENAEQNGFSKCCTIDETDIADIKETYPLVLANIEAHILIPMANALTKSVAPNGVLLLSGILHYQEMDVRNHYPNMTHLETTRKGEWVMIALQKSA